MENAIGVISTLFWVIVISAFCFFLFRGKKTFPNKQIVCQFCHKRNCVYVETIKRKKGISGGKATFAILTGGISLLATGLARKEAQIQLTCYACGMVYYA